MQLRGALAPKNIALAALVGAALVTGFWRLEVGTWHTDEAVYAAAGRAYVQGDARMNWEHPMLAKYLFGVSQALFGNSAAGVRVAPALAGASVAGILFLFARRVNGYWAGIGAAAAWIALPRAIRFAGQEFIPLKMERYALLDVIAAALGVCALFAGWRWIEDRTWRSALWAGALVGLAAGAKLPGALFLPGILVTAFAAHRCRLVAWQALAATTAAILVWSLTYAPLGRDAPAAMRFMFEFQSEHAAQGHPTWLAGNAYGRAPWWGQLWMQWDGDGAFVNILFLAGCLAFAALGPPRAAAYLLLAVAMPFMVLSASSVALPHYRYLWLPPLTLLAALGWATLVRSHGKLRLLGVGCWTAVAVIGLATLAKTLTISHSDYAKLEEVLAAREVYPGTFFVDGHSAHLALSFPASRFLTRDEFVGGATADVVVVDAIMERRRADPAVPAEASGRGMESLQIDRLKVWLSVLPG